MPHSAQTAKMITCLEKKEGGGEKGEKSSGRFFRASGRRNKNAPYFVGMVFVGLLPYVTFLFSWDYAIIIADKSCLLPWQRSDAWSSFGNCYSVYSKVHFVPDAGILSLSFSHYWLYPLSGSISFQFHNSSCCFLFKDAFIFRRLILGLLYLQNIFRCYIYI